MNYLILDPLYNEIANLELSCLGLQEIDPQDIFSLPSGFKPLYRVDENGSCCALGYANNFRICLIEPNETSWGIARIANNFEDFIRLVLACCNVKDLLNFHRWSKSEFYDFIKAHPPTPDQLCALSALKNRTGLTPMDHPYEYWRG